MAMVLEMALFKFEFQVSRLNEFRKYLKIDFGVKYSSGKRKILTFPGNDCRQAAKSDRRRLFFTTPKENTFAFRQPVKRRRLLT